jgi:molybdopterin-guanine dinucleotide biosynthesis protein B
MKVFGIAGYSGSGKTTLLEKLIPQFTARGLKVSVIKHAHHGFDIDRPGKDSYRHREAGRERSAALLQRPLGLDARAARSDADVTLDELLAHLAPCDLVLIEGFKQEPIPKLEVHRPENGKPPLFPDRPDIVAVATDADIATTLPKLPLNDISAIADFVMNTLQLQARPC